MWTVDVKQEIYLEWLKPARIPAGLSQQSSTLLIIASTLSLVFGVPFHMHAIARDLYSYLLSTLGTLSKNYRESQLYKGYGYRHLIFIIFGGVIMF